MPTPALHPPASFARASPGQNNARSSHLLPEPSSPLYTLSLYSLLTVVILPPGGIPAPNHTLSWGAFSAPSLVTPICADTSRGRVVPVCDTDFRGTPSSDNVVAILGSMHAQTA